MRIAVRIHEGPESAGLARLSLGGCSQLLAQLPLCHQASFLVDASALHRLLSPTPLSFQTLSHSHLSKNISRHGEVNSFRGR